MRDPFVQEMIDREEERGTRYGFRDNVLSRVLIACVLIYGFGPLGYFVSVDNATRTMKAEGWSNVTVSGRSVWAPHFMAGCDSTDSVGFSVDGKNAAHEYASATVCCGLIFKGCTVRH